MWHRAGTGASDEAINFLYRSLDMLEHCRKSIRCQQGSAPAGPVSQDFSRALGSQSQTASYTHHAYACLHTVRPIMDFQTLFMQGRTCSNI